MILLLFCEPKKSPAVGKETFPVFTSRVGRKTMATKLPSVSARARDPEEFSEKEVNLHSRGWLHQILSGPSAICCKVTESSKLEGPVERACEAEVGQNGHQMASEAASGL